MMHLVLIMRRFNCHQQRNTGIKPNHSHAYQISNLHIKYSDTSTMKALQSFAGLLSLTLYSLVNGALTSPVQTIASFSNNSFIENIAVRSNGHLLLNILQATSPATIFTLDPTDANPSPQYYASFPAPLTGITGIAEYAPGLFAVVAGRWNLTERRGEKFEIWSLDTTCQPPKTRRLAAIEDADITALNGATTHPSQPHVVLIAESNLGAIFSLDTRTRQLRKVIQDNSMSPLGPAPTIGINGVKSFQGHIYYTNSQTGTLNRVRVNSVGEKAGDVSVVTQFDVTSEDDLAIDRFGNSWVTDHPNSIIKVGTGGNSQVIEIGPESQVGPTAAAFGRGSRSQEKLLYIVNGDGTVQALDTSRV